MTSGSNNTAEIAQLGERQTEDLKVPGSIPGGGIFVIYKPLFGPKGGIVGSSPTRGAFAKIVGPMV